MVILTVYILYKGGTLLWKEEAVQASLEDGGFQKCLEEAAAHTWAGGYAEGLEQHDRKDWIAGWMRQAVPVYGYLAEHSQENPEGAPEEGGKSGAPRDGGKSGAPEEGGKSGAPRDGGKSGAPEDGGKSGAPRDGGKSGTPEDGGKSGAPEEGGRSALEQGVEEESRADRQETMSEEPAADEAVAETNTAEAAQDTEADGAAEETDPSEGELPEETMATAGTTEAAEEQSQAEAVREVPEHSISPELLEQLHDYNYLVGQYFTVDGGTTADRELLDADRLLSEDLSIVKNAVVPQILIYHTHSQEEFADSVPGDTQTTIVGIGEYLTELLEECGYQVIHDTSVYDLRDGVLDRSAAYDYAREGVEQLLEKYPTIEVIIDLHRDGVEGQKFVTEIDGRQTSKIMFFNGISRNARDEPLTYLANPYTASNLALSFQLELRARSQYPDFTRNIYLKAERFNLHLRPRSLLIEAGTQLNTVEEEKNAMIPLADLLNQVLSGM